MDAPHPGTPRHTRHRLGRMERWYVENRHRYALGRQAQLAVLFEVAATPEAANELAACLRGWAAEYERVAGGITALAHAVPSATTPCTDGDPMSATAAAP